MLPLNFSLQKRFFSFGLTCCVGLIVHACFVPQTFSADRLVSFDQATNNGLERAWSAQARVDASRNRVDHWELSGNVIFALTTSSTVHAMHAETGKTLWIAQVGNPKHPSTGPVANSNRVAVLNGSNLYLLDRQDGHVIWTRQVGNAAGTAPALSETHAYVTSINGRIEGFPLDSTSIGALQYQSHGLIFQPPMATGPYVVWSTDRGFLYVGNAEQSRVLFRIETNEEIIATTAEWGSQFYAASMDGYLYCYDRSIGAQHWRYSAGMAITGKPVVIDHQVFVASEKPALHAVDATTGNGRWTTEGAAYFVAQGLQHLYAADRYGNLLILDKETGSIAGQINTGENVHPMINEQTDRIFLVSDTGLIQCLHEIGAEAPTSHREMAASEETEKAEPKSSTDTEPISPAEEDENPFEAEEAPADDNPFGAF